MPEIVTISRIPNTKHFNFIDCSFLQSLHGKTRFRNIGIRYSGNGQETYTLCGKAFDITANRYLVGNQYAEGNIDIESKQMVHGVCIDLNPALVSEAVASYLRPETDTPDLHLDKFFTSPDFPVQMQHASTTHLGKELERLHQKSQQQPFYNAMFNDEFFMHIADLLVRDTQPVIEQMRSIKAIKHATRIDLFQKVAFGKLYLDEHFTEHCTIAAVAKEAGISEFHFFRLFKSVYGLSPYQYVLNRRISHARQLMRVDRFSISEIATLTGFADIFSFSKAFKRITGKAPSHLDS